MHFHFLPELNSETKHGQLTKEAEKIHIMFYFVNIIILIQRRTVFNYVRPTEQYLHTIEQL